MISAVFRKSFPCWVEPEYCQTLHQGCCIHTFPRLQWQKSRRKDSTGWTLEHTQKASIPFWKPIRLQGFYVTFWLRFACLRWLGTNITFCMVMNSSHWIVHSVKSSPVYKPQETRVYLEESGLGLRKFIQSWIVSPGFFRAIFCKSLTWIFERFLGRISPYCTTIEGDPSPKVAINCLEFITCSNAWCWSFGQHPNWAEEKNNKIPSCFF